MPAQEAPAAGPQPGWPVHQYNMRSNKYRLFFLWQSANLSESRISAALVKRFAPREGGGRHEIALQFVWQSGLAGSLDVDGKNWPVTGVREQGVWLTWRKRAQ